MNIIQSFFLKRLENALDKAVLKVRKILVYTLVHKLSKPDKTDFR